MYYYKFKVICHDHLCNEVTVEYPDNGLKMVMALDDLTTLLATLNGRRRYSCLMTLETEQ